MGEKVMDYVSAAVALTATVAIWDAVRRYTTSADRFSTVEKRCDQLSALVQAAEAVSQARYRELEQVDLKLSNKVESARAGSRWQK